MLKCLNAFQKSYSRGEVVFAEGDAVTVLGLVLKGSVFLQKTDYQGNTLLMAKVGTGELFGEALACIGMKESDVEVVAVENAEILFLDEPTLGLDVLARSDLWEVIRALKGKITIILTTHYMEEAEALSDEIGIMKDGRLLARGPAQALKKRAGTERFEDAFVAIVKGAAK